MQIAESARRHGIADEDIQAAVSVPLRLVLQGEDRVLVIGADTVGRLLEVVVLDPHDDPSLSTPCNFVRSSTGTSEEG